MRLDITYTFFSFITCKKKIKLLFSTKYIFVCEKIFFQLTKKYLNKEIFNIFGKRQKKKR